VNVLIIKGISRLKIYLRLVRPFTLVAPIVGFLCGAIIASKSIPALSCLLGASSATILNAGSNVINQYFDLDIDRINKPFRPFPSGEISGRSILNFSFMLYFSALILSLVVSLKLFLIISITAIISFCYSAPPFRIKKHPFLSNIFIALPRGMLLIVAGWSISKSLLNIEPWFIGLIFALYLVGAATTKDFIDIKGDRQFGIRTLPVIYGPKITSQIISPFFYLPFLLIPLGIIAGVVRVTTLPLTLLSIWGLYIARLIKKNPQELALEKNNISWIHMYLMLITGQIGFAVAYLL